VLSARYSLKGGKGGKKKKGEERGEGAMAMKYDFPNLLHASGGEGEKGKRGKEKKKDSTFARQLKKSK